MSHKIEMANINELIQRYLSGESEKALAVAFGVSRPVIRRRLLEHGIKPRNRSEGMFARMARTSPEDRSRLAEAAHAAVRGKRRTWDELLLRAKTREKTGQYVVKTEMILMNWFQARGATCTPQKAVGRYNVDIALYEPPIAVEVRYSRWPGCSRPKNHIQRTVDLLNAGWHVLYVLIDREHPLLEATADEIVSWAKGLRGLPSFPSQYRVIRGDGEDAPFLSSQFQSGACVFSHATGTNPSSHHRVPR